MNNTLYVDGLRDLNRVLRKMDATARKEVREKLRSVGRLVAEEAKSIATSKGLVDSGKLTRQIRPTLGSRAVRVVASATRKSAGYPQGFNYPKRYEFQSGGARAFMHPALENKTNEVARRFEDIFDELASDWSRG